MENHPIRKPLIIRPDDSPPLVFIKPTILSYLKPVVPVLTQRPYQLRTRTQSPPLVSLIVGESRILITNIAYLVVLALYLADNLVLQLAQ